jgi:hypothetical protein
MASCALAACHEIGGFFQFSVMLRKASQISFVAARSLGKWPLLRTALRTEEFRDSIAFVTCR